MSWQTWVTIVVIVLTVLVLVRDLTPPAITLLGRTAVLLVPMA
jgi:hypothetical protein